uniref:Ig-like domain-containing protein n=1 Tax=Neogobius melanostomus TaxID=47308 RepID=A0A8C6TEE7_9GOBI
ASDRVRITDGGATLTIVTVLHYDQGSYTCEVSNPVSSSISDEELFKTYNVLFLLLLSTEIITNGSVLSSNPPVEGGSVNLTCDSSGSIFTREWMINGVKPAENIVFYEEKKVLLFRVLTRQDSGRYNCRISNPVSSQSVDYTMNVNYGPDSIMTGPMEVQEGSTLKLSCSAESVPTAKYTWTKNGTTLVQSHEYTKDNIKFSDSGEYICRATNDVTLKSSEASHTVNVSGINFPQKLI